MLPIGRGHGEGEGFISDDEFLTVSRFAAEASGCREARFTSGRGGRSCHAGVTNLSIDETGDAYPCHLFHEPPFRLGNVFTDSFPSIFYGKGLARFTRSMDVARNNPTCAGCELRYLCTGGCKANNLHGLGTHRAPDLYCGFIRENILEELFESG
jgi:radical SAM protein with 4Fe4S-binding SPASM domain